jgi:hypothetical protein
MPTTESHDATRALIAGLLPDQRLALAHLLRCRRCRGAVMREAAQAAFDVLAAQLPPEAPAATGPAAAASTPGPPAAGGSDEDLDRVLTRVEAASLRAWDLSQLPADQLRRAVAAIVAGCRPPAPDDANETAGEAAPSTALDARLVATGLLRLAEDALDEPARAVRFGEAAWEILAAQDAGGARRTVRKLFRAAWALLRGHRVRGRLDLAEEAFRRVLPFLVAAPAPSEERAQLLAGLAQLRRAQRRNDEAVALLVEAATMFALAGERHGEAACRAQAGWLLVERLDAAPARRELALAHVHLDAELAPALAARVALLLAWCHLALGRRAEARERLRAARGLYERAADPGEETWRDWWEARIAALDGSADGLRQADEALDTVRRRLLAEGSVGEAARSTFDLLQLRVEAGRPDALGELGPDLLRAFGNRVSALRPAEMIDLLATWARQRSVRFEQGLGPLRQYFASLRPRRGERPDLIADVAALADRLLLAGRRGVGEEEDRQDQAAAGGRARAGEAGDAGQGADDAAPGAGA